MSEKPNNRKVTAWDLYLENGNCPKVDNLNKELVKQAATTLKRGMELGGVQGKNAMGETISFVGSTKGTHQEPNIYATHVCINGKTSKLPKEIVIGFDYVDGGGTVVNDKSSAELNAAAAVAREGISSASVTVTSPQPTKPSPKPSSQKRR